MVVVRLMGGLGNQMFQYAFGRRIALLRNTELKIDVTDLNDKTKKHTSRKFELDVFTQTPAIATEAEIDKFTGYQRSKIKRIIRRVFFIKSPYKIVGEPTHAFIPEVLNTKDNSLLIGFWQTEKYFLPIAETIRKDFTFEKPLVGLNKTIAEEITSSDSVSVHIRRGDYVYDPVTNKYHGTCDVYYYYRAVDLIKKKFSNIALYIFSDDMEWVKQNMKFDAPVKYINGNSGDDSYIDMQLMSLCKHNIIANSSFSWWGAWLNNNPGKIVVAPIKWINDSSVDTNDVIPEGWVKI